jgi:O-antigen/teichoic acid export membrane protein
MKLGRFAIYNLAGAVLPIATTIATAPFYIEVVGLERYGIITITWVVAGYGLIFDAGLSRAACHALSKLPLHSLDERRTVLFTVFWATLSLGCVGSLLLFIGLNSFVPALPGISPNVAAEYSEILPFICVAFPFFISAGSAGGVLESRGQFLAENTISSLGNVLGHVLPLIAAIALGPNLNFVIAAALLAQLLTVTSMMIFAIRAEKIVRLQGISRPHLKELFAFGGWLTLTNLISPIMSVLDTLFLGWKFGSATLTYYSVPMSVVARVTIVPLAVVRAIFPTLSSKPAQDAFDLALRSLWVLVPILALISSVGIMGSHAAITLWMGYDFAEKAAPVAAILFVGIYANGVAYVAYTALQAAGNPRIIALAHLFELPIYLLLLLVSVQIFGLKGAALAWTVRVVLDSVILQWRAGLLRKTWTLHALISLLLLSCLIVAAIVPMDLLGSIVAMCGAASTTILLILGFFPNVWKVWRGLIQRLMRHKSAISIELQR